MKYYGILCIFIITVSSVITAIATSSQDVKVKSEKKRKGEASNKITLKAERSDDVAQSIHSADMGKNSNSRENRDSLGVCSANCCPSIPSTTGPQGIQGIQGVQGVQGPLGASGPAGIPGRDGLKGDRGIQGRRGRKGDQAMLSQPLVDKYFPPVAFSVTMDYEMPPANEYRVVKYNIELYNPLHVYSVQDGTFTSPYNGTFLIGFNGVSSHGQNLLLHLVKNGQRVLSAFANSGCTCCGESIDKKVLECAGAAGNTGVIALQQADMVWIELADQYGLHNAPYHNYATFYGYLLFLTH